MKEEIIWKHISKKLKNNANRTILELCIENQMDIYNRFSVLKNDNKIYCDNARINHEVITYLEMETKNISPNNSLTININVFEQTNFDIDVFDKLLKEEIIGRIKIINHKDKKNNQEYFGFNFYRDIFDCMRRVHTPPLGAKKGDVPGDKYLTKTTYPAACGGVVDCYYANFQIFKDGYAFNELVIIISWVFIWKSVELFFFEKIKLLHKIVNFTKIYYSDKKIKVII